MIIYRVAYQLQNKRYFEYRNFAVLINDDDNKNNIIE